MADLDSSIEIEFHPQDAIGPATRTVRGTATLLTASCKHFEKWADGVTMPIEITIAGLNHMEHDRFSLAIIRGIISSVARAGDVTREVEGTENK
jgi:pyrroline-5-carboxylate reductase